MRRFGVLAGLAAAVLALAGTPSCRKKGTGVPEAQRTALSLRALQKVLARCQPASNCGGELLKLGGITWLEGYVVDPEHDDVVVYGQGRADWPEQATADFVVALRNAWQLYVAEQDGKTIISEPGCSIDPNPNVVAQLQALHTQGDSPGYWEALCRSPQGVRVLGIPFDTSFAKIMVDADYFMKRIVNGTAHLNLAKFESLSEMQKREWEREMCAKSGRDDKPRFSLNRFWFYPGETRLDVDAERRTTLIGECRVVLKTEQEHLAETGIAAAGAVDQLAEGFARQYSARYREIAMKFPIYKQLEQLYRMMALAKLLNRERTLPSLQYLLNDFPVPEVPVERSLPGIPTATERRYICGGKQGRRNSANWFPGCSKKQGSSGDVDDNRSMVRLLDSSCGGVEIAIKVENPRPRDLSVVRRQALAARPAPDALFWTFAGG